MQPGKDAPYRVVGAELVGDSLRGLKRLADAAGQTRLLLDSAKGIVERLETDPLGFGEPRYDLHHLQLQVRIGMYRMLAAQYAVDEERRIVYVLKLTPAAGYELS